jgi:phage protein D
MAGAIAYPVRRPYWSLTYAGKNITADVSAMVIEISYSDRNAHSRRRRYHNESEADELEVTFEDRDRRWQGPWQPTRGDLVGAMVGYYGVGNLLNCGIFQVDELELQGPPDTFHLKCIATGITPSLRTPRSAAYESQTLLQVAQTVAARQQLTVTGLPQNIDVSWQRITQHQEHDLHFLRRLALQHGYDFAVRGSQIVFYSRTALEQSAPVATIIRTQVTSFEFQQRTQATYRSSSVAYQDPATKKLISASAQDSSVPTGDDLHIVTRCETPQQAQLKSASALHDANMRQVTGRIEMEGTTLLVAGVNLTVQGFGNFDGTYHVESSRHRLERSSGYTTEIEIRQLQTQSGGAAI